jgi:radical SAM superfamily enzyme YgiQ (UPF0313 family)
MSSLAVHLLYTLFNSREDVACERVFYVPGEVPRSMESGQPLSKFDVVAFSFQFETDFVHAVEMLFRAGIPPFRKNRKRPWVIAGGPVVLSNPFPMEPFVDVFQVGDIEPVNNQLLNALIAAQSSEVLDAELDHHFLLSDRESVVRAFTPDLNRAPHAICQVIPQSPYPNVLEPTFGQSLLVEISRGCDRRCNFCLTTYQCSPRRERQLHTLKDIITAGVRCTDVVKTALFASGFIDHSQLGQLLDWIIAQQLQLSVPSLRADLSDYSILDLIHKGGQRTLTFAPEAGSERLRQAIAKSITTDVFRTTIAEALSRRFSQFKLYFMVGLPTESDEDVKAIQQFCNDLLELPPRAHRLHVSIAPFIPKPHTPFQWFGLAPVSVLNQRLKAIGKIRRKGRVKLDLPNLKWGVIQAVLSRGGPELAPLILSVAQANSSTAGTWFRLARHQNLDLTTLATTPFSVDDPLPWDGIDTGFKRNTLLQRYARLT